MAWTAVCAVGLGAAATWAATIAGGRRGIRGAIGASAALVAVGLCAGYCAGAAYWTRWEQDAAGCSRQVGSAWTAEVTEEGVPGPFGTTVAARMVGPRRGASVQLQFAKGQPAPSAGSVITLYGAFSSAAGDEPGRRLHREGFAGVVRARRANAAGWGSDVAGRLGPMRAWATARLSAIPGDGSALLSSVLLGDSSRLSGTQASDDYKASGISHLVGASGLHLLVLAVLVEWSLMRLRVPRLPRSVVVAGVMLAFAVVTGFRPAVVRACCVAVIGSSAGAAGRRADGVAATSAAVVVMLAYAPPAAFSAGFALSVLGVSGILLYGRLARDWAQAALPRAAESLAGPLSLTVCAQMATAAVSAPLFGTFSLVAPLANLVVTPVVVGVTAGGLVALGACALAPGAGGVALQGVSVVAGWVPALARGLANMPSASVAYSMPAAVTGSCAAVVAVGLWVWWPRSTRRRARTVVVSLVVVLGLSACGSLATPGGPRVEVLDVGQGDAILVQDGGSTLLVDTGPTSSALSAALLRSGIRRVDRLVITHLHDDHYGGIAALRREGVREALVPAGALGSANSALSQLKALVGVRSVREVVAGEVVDVGSLRVRVLWPRVPVADAATNQASIVLEVDGRGANALLTGDAESDVLGPLAKDGTLHQVDVLKVGHHGSTDAVDEDVLRALVPRVAVISVGARNRFGHPTRATLDVLARGGVPVVRTDQSGDVSVEFAETGVRIHTRGRSAAQLPARGERRRGYATLVATTKQTRLVPALRLETDARRSVRSEASAPHLRIRGPPPRTGAQPAQEARG